MTVDDLIHALQELKERCPAVAYATIIGLEDEEPNYEMGNVFLAVDCRREHMDDWSDDDEVDIEDSPVGKGA